MTAPTRANRETRPAAIRIITMGLAVWLGSGAAMTSGYDRPDGDPRQSRSVVMCRNGIVATSHPLAAQAGLEVLRAGGSAVDAAIAANAMLGVVEPMSCGIGGDLFAIVWDHRAGELSGLNASGRSPHLLNPRVFHERQLELVPLHGPLSWSTPGCVSGWETLHQRFGKVPFKTTLQAAIETAEQGFPVSELIAASWEDAAAELAKWPGSAAVFLPHGKAPQAGELFANPALARTYREIAERGAKAFYHGTIAERLDAFSQANGGFLRRRDLADHRDTWVDPVSTDYRGVRVWELPPNGQGIAALQMLNLLEPHDVRGWGPGSAAYLHYFVEAKKLAFADRARFYADPEMASVPTEALISKDYAARQGRRIDPSRAATDVPPGDPRLRHGDTVYITVVDKDRTCCSLIQSNYHGFGSHLTPPDLGFALQNRGALFTLEKDHPNALAPHKRPFHTIIPALATRPTKIEEGGEVKTVERPWLCFGVMGGDMQPQGHVQVLVNLIDFQMNVQQAGDAARIRHTGSATPRGEPAEGAGVVRVESGISDQAIAELRQMGHTVQRERSGGYGGYQGILIDWERGVLHGASEARKDGAAAGY